MFRKGKKALLFFTTDSEDIDIRRSFSSAFSAASIVSCNGTFPDWLSFFEAIDSCFGDDPGKIITTNIAAGGLYASVLNNTAAGRNTMKSLCTVLETDSSKMSKYLAELIENDVIRKLKERKYA